MLKRGCIRGQQPDECIGAKYILAQGNRLYSDRQVAYFTNDYIPTHEHLQTLIISFGNPMGLKKHIQKKSCVQAICLNE